MKRPLWNNRFQHSELRRNRNPILEKPWILFLFLLTGIMVNSGCTNLDFQNSPGSLLFQDDFSSSNSVWDRYRGDTYISDYHDGTYRIMIFEKDIEAWALPGFDFADVSIEVAGTSVNGTEDNVYGVICRYRDSENFYFFLVSSDGYAGIGRSFQGERELLTGESMFPSEAIRKGTATNLIQAQCMGSQLSLSVNGSLVYQVESDSLKSGDVGLIAGSYEDEGTEILFDNFMLKSP